MKSYVLIILVAFCSQVIAKNCKLPKNQKIIIGCTYHCGLDYKLRIHLEAFKLGYKVDFKTLLPAEDLASVLQNTDAILVPGGADINPSYYLDDVNPEMQSYINANLKLAKINQESHKRDPFEHETLSKYSSDEHFRNLPLLGICRGMQMMSVVQGAPLYLDIKTELGIPNRIRKLDRIKIAQQNSLMMSLFGSSSFLGLKLHHQGLRVPYYNEHKDQYPNLRITASSHNGKIAEAIEWTHRPALGVQYHPEKSFPVAATPVFKWFLTKACEYKTTKDSL